MKLLLTLLFSLIWLTSYSQKYIIAKDSSFVQYWVSTTETIKVDVNGEENSTYISPEEGKYIIIYSAKPSYAGSKPNFDLGLFMDFQVCYKGQKGIINEPMDIILDSLIIKKWFAKTNSEQIEKRFNNAKNFELNRRKLDSLELSLKAHKDIAALNSKKIYGIAIAGYDSNITDYLGGFTISFYNPTSKTIKYIWITTKPINPVGDLATQPKTVQAVGPITASEFATYSFEDIYYSKVIDKIMVSKLKIQYMDGSIKEIITPTLTKVWHLL